MPTAVPVTVIDNDFEIRTIVVEPCVACDDGRPVETIIIDHYP